MAEHQNAHATVGTSGERPYRSHLRPACLECRKRKSRCKTDEQSRTCILCRVRGTDCVFPNTNQQDMRKAVKIAGSRRSNSQIERSQDGARQSSRRPTCTGSAVQQALPHSSMIHTSGPITHSSPEDSMGFVNESHDQGPHVVAPAVADDNHELEDNLYTHTGVRSQGAIYLSSNPIASRLSRLPVSFTTVHRRPVGMAANQCPIALKCEIIEKLIEPHTKDLIQLFFSTVNICFPVFNETSFLRIYTHSKEKISAAVLSNLYANALTYWKGCSKLSAKHCPDARFIWIQANEVLNMEALMSPGLPVILAMILNIGGRPSTSIFGNGGMVGTAVALANALGLNRDPSDWKISDKERLFRIKTWWLLVIQDRWSSLAYGTPLLIHRNQFDVPTPKVEQLCETNSSLHLTAASIFVSVVTLTGVLGQILEHVYDVSSSHVTETLDSGLEDLFYDWEESQTIEIRQIVFRGTDLSAPGAANLRLSYLAVKFLLVRFQMGLNQRMTRPDEGTKARYLLQAQRAAEEIVHFVQELDEHDLSGFWFPMHSFILTSATTFLLRNTINSKRADQDTKRSIVDRMINTLRVYQQKYGWDLADDCLAKYDKIAEKLDSITTEPNTSSADLNTILDIDPSALDSAFASLSDYMQGDLDDYLSLFPFVDEQVFSNAAFGEQDQYLA